VRVVENEDEERLALPNANATATGTATARGGTPKARTSPPGGGGMPPDILDGAPCAGPAPGP